MRAVDAALVLLTDFSYPASPLRWVADRPDQCAGIPELSEAGEREFVEAGFQEEFDCQMARKRKKWAMHEKASELLPDSRLSRCCKRRVHKDIDVYLKRSLDSGTWSYGGLMRCGNLWGCTLCGPKVAEKKRAELNRGLEAATAKSWELLFGTFTAPHHNGQDPKLLSKFLHKAWNLFKNRKPWRKWKEEIGYEGEIRNHEATWSDRNSWHPHFHIIIFASRIKTPTDPDEQKALFQEFIKTLLPAW